MQRAASYYRYELRGVVVHSGSAFAGHYYSYIKVGGRVGGWAGGWWWIVVCGVCVCVGAVCVCVRDGGGHVGGYDGHLVSIALSCARVAVCVCVCVCVCVG